MDDRADVASIVARALETGVYQGTEHRILRPDGVVRWILARGAAKARERGIPTLDAAYRALGLVRH